MSGVYVVRFAASLSVAKTIIQIKAGAAVPLELLRVHISQAVSETSTQEEIQIVRKSVAATVTSFTPLKYDPNSASASAVGGTSATGTDASAEGTDTDILVNEGWNILSGWTWLPTPEERILVPSGGIVAIKVPVTPAAAITTRAYAVFGEIG